MTNPITAESLSARTLEPGSALASANAPVVPQSAQPNVSTPLNADQSPTALSRHPMPRRWKIKLRHIKDGAVPTRLTPPNGDTLTDDSALRAAHHATDTERPIDADMAPAPSGTKRRVSPATGVDRQEVLINADAATPAAGPASSLIDVAASIDDGMGDGTRTTKTDPALSTVNDNPNRPGAIATSTSQTLFGLSHDQHDSVPPKTPNYDVGYGKPPLHSRFKKGQSGNPKGRQKSVVDPDKAMQKYLGEKILVRMNGQARKITRLEATTMKLAELALKGNIRATQLLFASARQGAEAAQAKEQSATSNIAQSPADEAGFAFLIDELRAEAIAAVRLEVAQGTLDLDADPGSSRESGECDASAKGREPNETASN